MAKKDVSDAFKARQVAGWTTVPVYWPNDEGEAPEDLSAFVQAEFPVGRSQLKTLGDAPNRRFTEEGGVRFVIHVPVVTGSDTAFQYADELADLFRGIKLFLSDGIVQTWAPGPGVPLGEDGSYYKVSFSIPYRYDYHA